MNFSSEPVPSEINSSFYKKTKNINQKNTFSANSKKCVLAVDDNASMRAFLYDALSILDFKVVTAGSGAEGFEQFIQNSFDLVITDGQMPGMDGWQLADMVKKVSNYTPVIMVTGQDRDKVVDKIQAANIDFILFKPFDLGGFYSTVRASLEIKK